MKVHDYTNQKRRWGHDYSFTPINGGWSGRITGWGSGIEFGDVLLLSNPEDGYIAPYRIVDVDYYPDPDDMWTAYIRFDPDFGDA